MEAIWSTPARLQLAEIVEYIAADDPVAAINLDDKVDETVRLLEKFPWIIHAAREYP